MQKNTRTVFTGPVPAARLWVIVGMFAKARGLQMITDRHQQNAIKLYIETAAICN